MGHGTPSRSYYGSISLLAAYRRTSPVLSLDPYMSHTGVVLCVLSPVSSALPCVWGGTAVNGGGGVIVVSGVGYAYWLSCQEMRRGKMADVVSGVEENVVAASASQAALPVLEKDAASSSISVAPSVPDKLDLFMQ
ncbi:hypothetical protein E2C01_085745 [Portunus trituberculatus]|uniref:Uncharacterized protein n=1 Tax=Portunus trituberculatus TaxID=210409 RepID=A0A5B7JBI0_PORTR|nr:hypothetical protein [Portunus trituberculatus]